MAGMFPATHTSSAARNAPFTPGQVTRLLENATPTVENFRPGSTPNPPRLTRLTRSRPGSRHSRSRSFTARTPPSPPSPQWKSLPPALSLLPPSSLSYSQLDELENNETDQFAFSSPIAPVHFGSGPNHDLGDGLDHISDDLLDTPHPFGEGLVNDELDREETAEEEQLRDRAHDTEPVAAEVPD